jgi:hypothetical protein
MILTSKPLIKLIEHTSAPIQQKLQRKMKLYQERKTCNETKFLVYDLGNLSQVDCGLGCELHGFSSGLLCSIENDRQYVIVNYFMDQYRSYFEFFNSKCQINHENAGKLGKFLI